MAAGDNYPAISGRNFCNVSVNYEHTGKDDSINVYYYLPEPAQWAGRFLATGGFGYAINSGFAALDGGLVYNMAAGLTDGGFGSLDAELTDVLISANGTFDWDALINLAYLSIHEMTEIGTGLTASFYSNTSKVYTYYQACSEGGREGWSQIQRYGTQYDGAVVGAPAFRQAFQQPNHIWYAPYPPCVNFKYPNPVARDTGPKFSKLSLATFRPIVNFRKSSTTPSRPVTLSTERSTVS